MAAMRRGLLLPDIRPLERYDGERARSAASIAWVIASGYGGAANVPEELREPFYTDQYDQEHVKPPVCRLLTATDLYCRAWRHAVPPPAPPPAPPADTAALLALLGRYGVSPTFQERPVREAELRQMPLCMDAHLALIDSLLLFFVNEATRSLGPPPEPRPPPTHSAWEQRVLRWVDAVNRRLQESTERGGNRPAPPPDGSAPPDPKIRYRKDKVPPRHSPCFPPVGGLKDLANGGALAATIHYYCPDALRLEEVCLKEPMSVADSLYNLQLVRDFCCRHLRMRCPLALEDLLYMPAAIKLNVCALLAELFLCFEVQRPGFVRPPHVGGGTESPVTGDALSPDISSPGFNFRHPLLSGGPSPTSLRRSPGSLPHSPSLPHTEGTFGKGWSKNPLSHPLSQAVSFSIPFGLDSDVDIVMGNPLGGGGGPLARSASSDSLALPPHPPHSAPHRRSAPPQVVVPPPPLPTSPSPPPPTIEEALQIIQGGQRLVPEGAPAAFYLHSPGGDGPPPPIRDSPHIKGDPPAELGGARKDGPKEDDGGKRDGVKGDPPKPPPAPPVRMTSFAERKKHLEEAAVSGSPPSHPQPSTPPATTSGPPAPTHDPPGGDGRVLSTELNQLGARLEEKRRAIEAQKQRIEAIFAKHRQRLGRSAFLQLQRGGDSGPGDDAAPEAPPPAQQPPPPRGEPRKQVTFAEDGYGAAVAQLSTALSSLQQDMQRLHLQQQKLLREPRPPPGGHAWVIPPPPKAHARNAPSAPSAPPLSSAPPGPRPSPPPAHGGASTTPPPAPPPPPPSQKSPRRPRPAELRLPPLQRVLSPPRDVDSLPHLRQFSPSQVPVQTRSSIHFSEDEEDEDEGPPPPHKETRGPPRLDEEPPPSVAPPGDLGSPRARPAGDGTSDASSPGERRGSLVEVPLGGGAGGGDGEPEGDSLEGSPTEEGGAGGQQHRAGVGFFFKDEDKEEALMAQRRAALLERQQRRSAEVRQRRQWESERRGRDGSEHRAVPSDPPRPEEDPPRRGDFTRQEYERRQQLKLMADLDKVLRPPRSAPPRGAPPPRRPRPKSVFCDDSALARSPAKGALGARLSKVYSQSTLSLSTVTAEAAGTQSGKGASRAASPSAPISPGRAPPGKEREWENGSTASSPASGQEYTGPRLYKEPSAKSNKHIIHNALAHCCLAGRANEQQKNRVLEEVEKSSAQHFLILFRDGGCQFRALYTRGGGDPPELRRLAGWGPRAVPLPMVEGLYKYHSDRKRFSRIPATTMSLSVDAFTIPGHLWPPRKGGGGGGGGGRQGGGGGGSK